MLTRPRERGSLITSAKNLSFLVLDELHTYRGRQGADVAMLVRRLRGAVGADGSCSASAPARPWPGPGTTAEQRSRSPRWRPGCFGTPIPPSNIVGRNPAAGHRRGDRHRLRLTARLSLAAPSSWAELQRDDPGRLDRADVRAGHGRRGQPGPTVPDDGCATPPCGLHELTGVEPPACEAALRETLLAGLPGPRPRRAVAVRVQAAPVHRQGRHRLHHPGPPATSATSPPSTSAAPRTAHAGQPLFPLAFCRECGQDYPGGQPGTRWREFSPASAQRHERRTGRRRPGCCCSWTPTGPTGLGPRCSTWCPRTGSSTSGGTRELDKARRTGCPTAYRVDQFGTVTDDGLPAAFFERLALLPVLQDQLREHLAVGVLPGVEPGHRGPGQRGHGAVAGGGAHPAGGRPTSTPTRGSSWRSPIIGRTPACRPATSTTSCWSGWSAPRCIGPLGPRRNVTPTSR